MPQDPTQDIKISAIEMETAEAEGRVKIFMIDEREILARMCIGGEAPFEMCALTIADAPPKGGKLIRVFHDPAYLSFAFVVAHPGFEKVIPGMICPISGSRLCSTAQVYRRVDIKRPGLIANWRNQDQCDPVGDMAKAREFSFQEASQTGPVQMSKQHLGPASAEEIAATKVEKKDEYKKRGFEFL